MTSPSRPLSLSFALLAVLASVIPAGAQNRGPVRPPAAAPAPAEPLELPEPPDLEAVLENGINFPNASIVRIVLPIYKMLTEKKVILDTNIADNNVQILLRGPVEKEEAVEFIEATLLLNGYVFVPTHREDTVKLLNAGSGTSKSEPDPVFLEGDELPVEEQVITYVMNLNYVKPEEAIRIFPQIVQLHSYGSLAAVPNASAIIITENVALIRKLIALKEAVDVPSAQVAHEFFELERADAEKVAEYLTTILEADDTSAKTVRQVGGRTPTPPAGGTAAAGANAAAGGAAAAAGGVPTGGGGESPTLKVVADTRTNRILAVARPLDLKYIATLVEEFDAPSKARTFLQRQLRFITASDFLPLVNDALSRDLGDEGRSGGSGGLDRNRTNASRSSTNNASASNLSSNRGSSGFGGSAARSGASLNAPDAPPLADSILVGKTLVVADNERNAIIVSGPPESVRLVEELLDQIDVRPRQVYLSTVIGQMNLNGERQFGVSAYSTLRQINERERVDGAGSLFTGALSEPVAFPSLDDIGNVVEDVPSLSGLTLYGQIAEDLNVYLRLLQNTNRFRLLSRPSVFTANNRKAIIQSGQRIAVPTTTLSNLNSVSGAVTSNIEYRDVVLKLEVIPLINSENEVTLQIAQVNDQVIGSQTVAGNTVPIISTEEIVTTVTVSNGQTIALGGLITEQTEKTRDGVPVLMDIPVLKHAFSNTRDVKRRNELLIFIQPQIVNTEEELIQTNVDEVNRTERGEEAVEFAVPEFKEYREELPTKDKLFDRKTLFGDFGE